jgi:hypothetical protein
MEGLKIGTTNFDDSEKAINEAFKQANEKAIAIVRKGREMRAEQVKYFTARDQLTLKRSKELEAQFDKLLQPKKQAEQTTMLTDANK